MYPFFSKDIKSAEESHRYPVSTDLNQTESTSMQEQQLQPRAARGGLHFIRAAKSDERPHNQNYNGRLQTAPRHDQLPRPDAASE